MKKTMLLLAATVLSMVASADTVKYLTFRTADGTESSLPISGGVDITFSNGELVAQASGSEFRASLTDVRDMWFTYEATSIESVLSDSAAAGNRVDIFSSDGRRIADFEWVAGQAPTLPAGFYIVRTGGRSQKVHIK